jgi:hypothetical protein
MLVTDGYGRGHFPASYVRIEKSEEGVYRFDLTEADDVRHNFLMSESGFKALKRAFEILDQGDTQ